MNIQDAITITTALKLIEHTLEGHSKDMEDSIIVGFETDQGNNFYISNVEELLEIGSPVQVRESGFDSWPYEVYTIVSGVEIRSMCTEEELLKYGLPGYKIK